ncbi:hypothetical protein [Enterococcus saccharolyticus]|uniref:Uncharacterized protein n=1 Tax=Enterococcus saccharolyticus subsp. saccharolyticus ATCC 43076 TaxID=1139996 RepID=S0JMJ4_9ENTE|nr:hypothetical protein [Enterococcus saccharolyticus]EOT28458.1 hypothetical protein OMQ_01607 [Enterococcus saccharolyticus subsp. saccharolyticus ATCC 43076]EOT29083.1 hypothetical protein OMQ_01605 [Enterococcus saccharolyticus subsp. saccharolyticus ATCC 43076]EOT81449.1 hypothetical protein I572_01984 [Enterococcus saccharolyticus subsp. saccharolyticus ATCC 43076]OJG84675.1 hypothetical protein RV16_GL001621 [Enterococcus saccharolyticus]
MKKLLILGASLLTLGSTVLPGTIGAIAYADDITGNEETTSSIIESGSELNYDDLNSLLNSEELPDNVFIENTPDGPVVVVYEENNISSRSIQTAANVMKWGPWTYTNIAVSTGVLAGSINTALYSGIGVVAGTVGLPALAISGLLNAAQWTKLGNAPGNAVAKKWDKNGNGWVGFYKSSGYDGMGRIVATKYMTK